MATLNWSGRSWNVWDRIDPNSGKYYFSPRSVNITPEGWLRMDLFKSNNVWYAPCLNDLNPTGWGKYQWVIQGLHLIDKNSTFGLFAYDWHGHDQELDIEQGQWGYIGNAGHWDMLVQPSRERGGWEGPLPMPNYNDIICTIEWLPGKQSFSMVEKNTGKVLKAFSSYFNVSAVSPYVVAAYMNLYPFPAGSWATPVFPASNQYYVIKSFTYTKPGSTPVTPPVKAPTALTLAAPSSARVGTTFTIYGVLTSNGHPVVNAIISLTKSWNLYAPAPPKTDVNGYFAVSAKLTAAGTATVTANFGGYTNLAAATSPKRTTNATAGYAGEYIPEYTEGNVEENVPEQDVENVEENVPVEEYPGDYPEEDDV